MKWWRAYHGMPSDPKFLLVQRHIASQRVTDASQCVSPVTRAEILAVWVSLLDFASQNDPRGSLEDLRPDEIAAVLEISDEAVHSIISAFEGRGMIVNKALKTWEKWQVNREDDSAPRTREWRDRKRSEKSHNVTHGDANVTHGDEEKRNVTLAGAHARSQSNSLKASSNPIQQTELDTSLTPDELAVSWERHGKHRRNQPQQLVTQNILSMNGGFDTKRFRERHQKYCQYWEGEENKWKFCDLSFFEWVESGMPWPPSGEPKKTTTEPRQKRPPEKKRFWTPELMRQADELEGDEQKEFESRTQSWIDAEFLEEGDRS